LTLCLIGACCAVEVRAIGEESANAHATDELHTLLDLHGLGNDSLAALADGTPIARSEMPVLLKALYVLGKLPVGAVESAAADGPDWTEIRSIPAAHRGDAVRLRGTLVGIEPVEIDDNLFARFELSKVFRCEIEVPSAGRVLLYTSVVPTPLQARAEGQVVQAEGLFMKVSADGSDALPVFAARRLAWFPDDLLGRLGVDVGLLESISQRTALSDADREPFYMLLGAADRLSADDAVELRIDSQSANEVAALFASPERFVGKLISVRGTARRAVLIKVSDAETRQRFGLDHYYEVEVFVRVQRLKAELNPLAFVFCLRELPPGVNVGNDLHAPVVATGIFFKLWTYRSNYAREIGTDLRQIAPLSIGRTMMPVAVRGAARGVTPVLLSLAVGAVAAVGAVVWWLNWSDRHRRAG
jgi:hypothetical protein